MCLSTKCAKEVHNTLMYLRDINMILTLGSFILQLHWREKLFKECNERIRFIHYKVIKPYSI